MLAITISIENRRRLRRAIGRATSSIKATCSSPLLPWLAAVGLLSTGLTLAQTPASEARARQTYEAAREHFEGARTNVPAAWQLGRAAFDLADLLEDNAERDAVAQLGAEACRTAIALKPNLAAAHYYLALNLGELARVRKLGALKILRDMERKLLTACELDPSFDYGGPDRARGSSIWRRRERLHGR